MPRVMRILVTGSRGFIGKNLLIKLQEQSDFLTMGLTKDDPPVKLAGLLASADAVVHLAGVNRPDDEQDFARLNTNLTGEICDQIESLGRRIPLIFSSSIQAGQDNPYGRSKREAEQIIERFSAKTGNPAMIYRLPGVFGKWSRPNYNSVVATFCHNIANNLPIKVTDPKTSVKLVYIDDVISEFINTLQTKHKGVCRRKVKPQYTLTLQELTDHIFALKEGRASLVSERVGAGFMRALNATYLSYMTAGNFIYNLPKYEDERGSFVEMLKTHDTGQISYFTAHPGITRGGHYHHTKNEKFLVAKGDARFCFRHVLTNETHEIFTSGERPQIVEAVPGWAHDITNVGEEEMVVILWANEIYNKNFPDTVELEVQK